MSYHVSVWRSNIYYEAKIPDLAELGQVMELANKHFGCSQDIGGPQLPQPESKAEAKGRRKR